MENKNYMYRRSDHLKWQVMDKDTNVVVEFLEGAFDQTMDVTNPKHVDVNPVIDGIRGWVKEEAEFMGFVDVDIRIGIIGVIKSTEQLVSIAEALRGMVSPDDADEYLDIAYDCLPDDAPLFTDEEMVELVRMVDLYWHSPYNIEQWANDILWWPQTLFGMMEKNESPKQTAEKFGQSLKVARTECGISLQELAQATGLDAGIISKIENGKANPTLQTILKLTNEIGKSLCLSDLT